jgi:hypothetical protein
MLIPDAKGPPLTDDYYWMRLCTLGIIPFFVLVGTFWGILGFNIPPFDAATSAVDLAQHFQDHGLRLRIAYAVAVPSWGFVMIWSVGIFGLMRRMEGSKALLPYLELMGGGLTSFVPTMASIFWLAAALRPERDPALTQLLYDLGWLTIDIAWSVTTVQYVAAGIVFLKDKRSVPLIPKWISWLGIWLGVEFAAQFVMPNFRSGPFSWAGLFNYWIPFFGPFLWMALLSMAMIKAFKRLESEDREGRLAS